MARSRRTPPLRRCWTTDGSCGSGLRYTVMPFDRRWIVVFVGSPASGVGISAGVSIASRVRPPPVRACRARPVRVSRRREPPPAVAPALRSCRVSGRDHTSSLRRSDRSSGGASTWRELRRHGVTTQRLPCPARDGRAWQVPLARRDPDQRRAVERWSLPRYLRPADSMVQCGLGGNRMRGIRTYRFTRSAGRSFSHSRPRGRGIYASDPAHVTNVFDLSTNQRLELAPTSLKRAPLAMVYFFATIVADVLVAIHCELRIAANSILRLTQCCDSIQQRNIDAAIRARAGEYLS